MMSLKTGVIECVSLSSVYFELPEILFLFKLFHLIIHLRRIKIDLIQRKCVLIQHHRTSVII